MNSHAVIAMPGGIGTLEELFEMITWKQLAFHKKPIYLLNILDFWSKTIEASDFYEHFPNHSSPTKNEAVIKVMNDENFAAINEEVLSEENENDLIDAIYKNSIQYYPFLKNVERQDCWRTVRALPVNHNDARLSEIFINKKNQNHITILSGKISTCWKVAYEIKSIIRNKVKLEEEIVV